MTGVRVRVLGPVALDVAGTTVALTPSSARILALLVAAGGSAVPVSRLHRAVWPDALDHSHRKPYSRTDVQKRVSTLRRAMDRAGPGTGMRLLRTETVITGRTTESAYRLVLNRESLDCAEFEHLVSDALTAPPATAAELLTRALDLWHGPPLREAGTTDFATAAVQRLHRLHDTALREVVSCHVAIGRLDEALRLAERAAAEKPDDPDRAGQVSAIRTRLRDGRPDVLLRRDLNTPRCAVVAVQGDLFAQDDAHLVVGFTDTFDVSTHRNEQISAHSVQGQMLERLFGGDTAALDRELRRGLRGMSPAGRERPRDKPKGKRVRYPIGTVVPLPQGGRLVFAVAYSRQRNDLSAESGPAQLRSSLVNLWSVVARRGQLRPVAVPLVGSKLARIPGLSRADLMSMIIDTFAEVGRAGVAVATELRIVLLPSEVRQVDLAAVVWPTAAPPGRRGPVAGQRSD